MKTSIVYQSDPGRMGRAYYPGEAPPGQVGGTVKFRAAHTREVWPLGPGPKRKEFVRDSVDCPNATFELERGRTDDVRVIPESYVSALDAMDGRILELEQELRDLLAEAFRRGRPLRRSDLEGGGALDSPGRKTARDVAL